MIKKLRIKFIAVNMGIVCMMLSVLIGLIFHFTRINMERDSIRMMQAVSSRPFVPKGPNAMEKEMRVPYFIIQVEGGKNIVVINKSNYDLSDQEIVDSLVKEAITSGKKYGRLSQYDLRFLNQMIRGCPQIVFSDISGEKAMLDSMMKNCVLIGCFSILLLFGMIVWLSKWAIQPVEEAWKQQRQFVADASHELKTPLTVIITNADLAKSEGYSMEEKRKFVDNICTVSQQMKFLIEQMLELARSDNSEQITVQDIFDLGDIVTHVVLTFEALLYENDHPLISEIEEGINVCGDRERLRQVIEILLDNAGKYASKGGKIYLSLKKKDSAHCILKVQNEGKMIPTEQLKELFKRFYRADSARSRNGSYGLGLSIAESIVQKHKGKIWAESKEGMNTFCVLLPIK